MDNKKIITYLIGACLLPSVVSAENWADNINVSGFMSAKYQQSDEENVDTTFDGINKDGSFSGTSLGINMIAPVSEKITLATQLFSTKEENNYGTHLDWAIASYSLSEDIQLRAGKIKFTTGLVSEYVDVGNSYPWINAPKMFYTEDADGPNTTREAYSGASFLMEKSIDDLVILVDIYTGEMELESMTVKKLKGAKLKFNYDDMLNFQVTYYEGLMRDASPMMEGKIHSNIAMGMNLDWNNIIAYAEVSQTDMELDSLNGTSGYATLGYQIDDYLPHITYQFFEKGDGTTNEQKQNMITVGMRYDLADSADMKFEYSKIDTVTGECLFSSEPTNENTNMIGIAFDLVF